MKDNFYKVFALKYASVARKRSDNFLYPVENGEDSMTLDFYVWLLASKDHVVLVDTGFSQRSSMVRNREFLMEPLKLLQRIGYEAHDIQDVIITHLHYDHAGNLDKFPEAKIWVQERELHYATGKNMCDPKNNHFYSTHDMSEAITCLYDGQLQVIDGFYSLSEGVELFLVGGHTDGLQAVRVKTAKGWIVLASDAAHYYENLITRNPFPAIHSIEDMKKGYEQIERLASAYENIIPGHDPLVITSYPIVSNTNNLICQIA